MLLSRVQAAENAAGEIDWDVAVDSTVVRAHQRAAGARKAPPAAVPQRGAAGPPASTASATRSATPSNVPSTDSRASGRSLPATRRAYIHLGTATLAALMIWLRT
jgi:hypothetical protein